MLVIIALAFFWYALVPICWAFVVRRSWRIFRRRFDALRRTPLLDYASYRNSRSEAMEYRFLGGFESVTDSKILWVRNDNLTVPVDLSGARIYLLPAANESEDLSFEMEGDIPERIRWTGLDALSEGARVYIGGSLYGDNGRSMFRSSKESPLLVILYDGKDRSLMMRTVKAGRHKNEYWNILTPYALAIGIFIQLIIALNYLSRPAFRLASISAFIAMFGPLFPLVPPGVLFTALYRRLWRRARIYRTYRDLVRLPLTHTGALAEGQLPNGMLYGYREYSTPPVLEDPPLILPPGEKPAVGEVWRFYGELKPAMHPVKPLDPMAAYTLIPGDPDRIALKYAATAYILEVLAMLALFSGVVANVVFIGALIYLLV